MSIAWGYLRTTPLGELLTGTAHEAHPTDITAPLGVRFAGRTVLALHVALEKAATVRVAFDGAGRPRLSGIRNIRQRNSTELVDVLRTEAAGARAEWVVIVLATGWQAVLGQRSARPEPGEPASAFSRYRLMLEAPESIVPRAQIDRIYTAVDHPVLDKSVVFSVRRQEVEELLAQVRKAGLRVAGVRIAVAAQLELWLAAQGEAGLSRDLLLSDGLSALLLNTEQRDFVPPRGAAVEADLPRQAVQRPGAIDEDIARFVAANAGRSVTFIGPEDLCASVKKALPDAEIVRPPDAEAHDTQCGVLAAQVRHELHPEAREVRPALERRYRRLVLGYGVLVLLLAAVAAVNASYAIRTGYQSFRLERTAAQRAGDAAARRADIASISREFADANALRSWVAGNFHAQRLCYALLKDMPSGAVMDRLVVEMRDGQITLTFVVLGDQDLQLRTHRSIERAINDLRYKIGGEDLPVSAAGASRAVQYRMHLIAPDPGEAAAS